MVKRITNVLKLESLLLISLISISSIGNMVLKTNTKSKLNTMESGKIQDSISEPLELEEYNGIAPPEKSATNTFSTGKGYVGGGLKLPTTVQPPPIAEPKREIVNLTNEKIANDQHNIVQEYNGFAKEYNSKILSDGFKNPNSSNFLSKYQFLLYIIVLILV